MARYRVHYAQTEYRSVVVEADTLEAAINKVYPPDKGEGFEPTEQSEVSLEEWESDRYEDAGGVERVVGIEALDEAGEPYNDVEDGKVVE
jgi:hypothetical protein